ncbi:uncharacterized membrane protein At1g75140 [Selaginella moellendorffii]|nr:uncharacterized membrane protein At1g75140 [Selaginella moellendorffii]|eukprot:XP_002980204.2 uncharacterized membrane protein At1g75140 [Selaginella moellendorffii]
MSEDGSMWRAAFFVMLLGLIAARCSEDQSLCDGLGAAMCPERGSGGAAGGLIDDGGNKVGRSEQQQHGELENLIRGNSEQLDRLRDLVDRLADLVRALDDTVPARRNFAAPGPQDRDFVDRGAEKSQEEEPTKIITPSPDSSPQQGTSSSSIQGAAAMITAPAKVRVVARYKPAWSDHFQFLSAVHLEAPLSSLHILPHEGEDGMGKYVAVGDEAGHLYIFSSLGDLLVDHSSPYTAPVTTMISVILRRNETLLVTGYSNGAVLAYRVWESVHRGSSSVEDWTSLRVEFSHTFVDPFTRAGGGEASPILHTLEMYRVGRMRYLLVADASGKIQVFRDNGTLYGTAESPSRPLAFLRTSSTQRLLFLTASGAASLDLRTMTVRSSPCEGLRNSSLVAYAFDASGRSKAYGVTENGDLIYVTLSGDTLHFDCHARVKRKLDLQGPVRLHGLKGYILIVTPREVAVYNTTLHSGFGNSRAGGRGSSRSLFTASIDEISQTFLSTPVATARQPLVVCDRDKLVVLGFGEGYVGMFRSNLPVHRPGEIGAKFWGMPVFFTTAVLALAWFFMNRKRDQVKMEERPQASSIAAASTSAASTGFGAAPSVTGTNSSGENTSSSGIVLRSFDRSGLVDQKKILDETRRFVASPGRGVYGGGSGGATSYGVGSVNFRNAVEHTTSY